MTITVFSWVKISNQGQKGEHRIFKGCSLANARVCIQIRPQKVCLLKTWKINRHQSNRKDASEASQNLARPDPSQKYNCVYI